MHAANVTRPPFQTFDYECETDVIEPDTDLILPLMRKHCAVMPSLPSARTRHVLAQPAAPMIVDKDQLVRLVRVLRPVPATVPPRVRHLSAMVIEERTNKQRRARERVWLERIGFLAVLGFVMFVATRPVVGALFQQACGTHGWCAGAR